MNKILVVTGGAGFVGSNLIEFLLKKTKYKIISLDDYSSGSKKNHIYNKRIKYLKCHTKNISIKLNKYKANRLAILEEKIDEYQNTQPVMVNRSIAEKAVSKKKDIRSIDYKIENEILIIQHVENICKNISFATNDIKNLVELMKLEMQ